jgi:hypothetical protein
MQSKERFLINEIYFFLVLGSVKYFSTYAA